MYLLVLYFPLIGALTAGFFGKFIGHKGSCIITTTCIGLTSLISFFIFYEVGLSNSICSIKLFNWIDSSSFYVQWGFLFDSLTSIMLIVVTFISFLVHLYSISYMSADPHLSRFMSYLSLFTFFMLMLITADNFLQMFLGWEGVGLSSYLLINFWFTRLQANKAAIKALIVNRIGDFGLSLGIMFIFLIFNSLDFSTVFLLAPLFKNEMINIFSYNFYILDIISFLLFIGAVGKSAQLGLHTWLPDAMEGPTPVSALIHAATMVTAGVFVLIRCSPILEYSPNILLFITIVGSITAFFAATVGMLQNDLKRVIAYSTCSQLGYMVFACGLSNYSVSLFHLMNHAFFKALLFLSAGAIIHSMSDEQDMRKMGGLIKLLPFTYSVMLIGSLSLMGFPFLTGFYSKDVILELAYAHYTIQGTFAHWLGTISAFFTAFYSFRLLYLTFLTKTNAFLMNIKNVHEVPLLMAIPLIILTFGSIFIGYLTKDMIIGLGTNFWNNSIYNLPENIIIIDSEFLPFYIKMIPVFFSILGALVAFILNEYFQTFLYYLTLIFKVLYTFLNKKWYFDIIYNKIFVKFFLNFGYNISFKLIDRGIIELFGPLGIIRLINKLTLNIKNLQTGHIYNYIFLMVVGIILLISIISLNLLFLIDFNLLIIYIILLLFLINQK